ncbi:Eukaryotic translation initiation factor 2A [Sarcoptes scabiei]|uniref:Eukaryotic translation initiation factor 2A n=2 Tax=Sarcoptes scabiei TaxID=52283 RepID=A0A834RH02_SARSC|nr:Eukaryotic translation initiation factor 2A [Sarcoptes scabiei]
MSNKREQMQPNFIVHDSDGVHYWSGEKLIKTIIVHENNHDPDQLITSDDGNFFAIVYSSHIDVYTDSLQLKTRFDGENIKTVKFSPNSTYLFVHHSSTSNDPKNKFKIYELSTENLIHEYATKSPQSLMRWSKDETIAYKLSGSDIVFYEKNRFEKCSRQFSVPKLSTYSFATNRAGSHYIALFIRGKDALGTVKIHHYPNTENAVASKSFYKADSVEIKWNHRGDAILILSSTDHDSSGKSYYGVTMLHYLNLLNESHTITGRKEGTVSAAEWLANNDGFLVIQGRMPAEINWYNNRGDLLHSFGEAAVNTIKLNPFNNLVVFAGFGNLSGNIFVWNLKTKQLISNFRANSTTKFFWLADGQHMITATHFERIRVENGFKLWNYLGSMIHQHECLPETKLKLHNILPFNRKNDFNEPEIDANVKGHIPEPEKKYVPPGLQSNTVVLTKPAPPLPKFQKSKESKEKKLPQSTKYRQQRITIRMNQVI